VCVDGKKETRINRKKKPRIESQVLEKDRQTDEADYLSEAQNSDGSKEEKTVRTGQTVG
jgi:hypothetical protein